MEDGVGVGGYVDVPDPRDCGEGNVRDSQEESLEPTEGKRLWEEHGRAV